MTWCTSELPGPTTSLDKEFGQRRPHHSRPRSGSKAGPYGLLCSALGLTFLKITGTQAERFEIVILSCPVKASILGWSPSGLYRPTLHWAASLRTRRPAVIDISYALKAYLRKLMPRKLSQSCVQALLFHLAFIVWKARKSGEEAEEPAPDKWLLRELADQRGLHACAPSA